VSYRADIYVIMWVLSGCRSFWAPNTLFPTRGRMICAVVSYCPLGKCATNQNEEDIVQDHTPNVYHVYILRFKFGVVEISVCRKRTSTAFAKHLLGNTRCAKF